MTRSLQILLLLCITFSSCNQSRPELTSLSSEWKQDTSTFWRIINDSDVELLTTKDTSTTDYITRKVFTKRIHEALDIEKIILVNSENDQKISESDLYKRKLGPFTESHVSLTFDFQTNNYSAYLIDYIGTEEKIQENQQEAENAQEYADKNDLYLCGTAYLAILNQDIPEFPIRREISKDSALSAIDQWTKNKRKTATNNK